jgi:hypothetical protein
MTAAPTRKREYGAYAFSRALCADERSSFMSAVLGIAASERARARDPRAA